MTIDLYYFPLSPPVRAVILLAKALGIHLNLKVIDVTKGEQHDPEFVKISPQHTIPTIDDHGFILSESRAIMAYLVNKYAKNDSLYPKDPKEKGIVDERIYFDISKLWMGIFNTYIPVIFGMTDEVSEESIAGIERAFEILNTFLEGNDFVAGDHLTIADFSIAISTHFAEMVGFDIARYDNVAEWYERCKETLEKYGFEEVNTPALVLGEWYRANLKEE
ncbi:glutathione S-transferase 1-1 [Diachasma alloeum]|uniref:glutathione S-transferase 1-1 n=1 Tax=Diachasma alloeum TaxID=454923 RepID=UPI0007384696|nr:glutathione S-transferase 1-1 [Diachasma alloeum]